MLLPFLDRTKGESGLWFPDVGERKVLKDSIYFSAGVILAMLIFTVNLGWLRSWFPEYSSVDSHIGQPRNGHNRIVRLVVAACAKNNWFHPTWGDRDLHLLYGRLYHIDVLCNGAPWSQLGLLLVAFTLADALGRMAEMKQITFVASAITLLLLLYGATIEYVTPNWKSHQSEYSDFVADRGKSFEVTQRQLVLPHLDKIDRCVICHVGIMDPAAAELDNPLANPSGRLSGPSRPQPALAVLFVMMVRAESYQLLTRRSGTYVEFWEEPALEPPFLEANCARCHRADMPHLSGSWQRGERLFVEGGCQGCHKVRGKGGALGPELTTIGQASFHLKRPARIQCP